MKRKRKLTDYGIEAKKRLLELGMTQKELAKKIGVSESYLADVFYGEKLGKKYISKIDRLLASKKNRELKGVI